MEFRRARCCDRPHSFRLSVSLNVVENRYKPSFSHPILAVVNRSGHDCPYSLRMMACLLLYEITSFLRETYDTLPKLSSIPPTAMNFRQQRANNQPTSAPPTVVETSSTLTEKRSSDRIRMGSVASQTSNRSSASISSEHPARA